MTQANGFLKDKEDRYYLCEPSGKSNSPVKIKID